MLRAIRAAVVDALCCCAQSLRHLPELQWWEGFYGAATPDAHSSASTASTALRKFRKQAAAAGLSSGTAAAQGAAATKAAATKAAAKQAAAAARAAASKQAEAAA